VRNAGSMPAVRQGNATRTLCAYKTLSFTSHLYSTMRCFISPCYVLCVRVLKGAIYLKYGLGEGGEEKRVTSLQSFKASPHFPSDVGYTELNTSE
jgi:hypothetical protein